MKKQIYSADFETTEFNFNSLVNYELKAKFICLVNFETKEKLFFNLENDSKAFRDFINGFNTKKTVRIYFHNLNFDFAFLFDYLPKQYKMSIIMTNSRLLCVKLYAEYKTTDKKTKKVRKRKTTIIELRNSLSVFNTSLKAIGKSLGYNKLEQDYNSEINDEYIEYCYRDCKIIIKAFQNLINHSNQMFLNLNLNLHKIPLTISSLNKKIFHKMLYEKYGNQMTIRLLYHKSVQDLEVELRDFYVGGRVEVYNFNICENGCYNDINSLYSEAMIKTLFPLGIIEKIQVSNLNDFYDKLKIEDYFAFMCEITEINDIPLIPCKINGKLVFGVGKKQWLLFRNEIEVLIQQKTIFHKCFYALKCEFLLDIFSDYINPLYKTKCEAKDFSKDLAKIKMNGLYGKFAERKEKETIDLLYDISELNEIELNNTSMFELDNKILYLKREPYLNKTLKTNMLIAMVITSKARLIMYEHLINNSDNLFYTDTDSIVSTNKAIFNYSDKIGEMKKEFVFDKFQAFACKEYAFEKDAHLEYKQKGFGSSYQKNALVYNNIEQFKEKYLEKKRKIRQIGFLESFNREIDLKTMLSQTKQKNSFYDKRVILDNLKTRAIHLQHDNIELITLNNEKLIREKVLRKNDL